uniref:MPN domain-containing protein n=1 Tax=Panagrellus redivivus TaxID=6233 RepID=A0A7E4VXU6_PANRE
MAESVKSTPDAGGNSDDSSTKAADPSALPTITAVDNAFENQDPSVLKKAPSPAAGPTDPPSRKTDLFETSELALKLIKPTSGPIDEPKVLKVLNELFPRENWNEGTFEEATNPEWLRVDRNLVKYLLGNRDDYYLLKYTHKHCENPAEKKKRQEMRSEFEIERSVRRTILMFARARIPVALEAWEEDRTKNNRPHLDKDKEHCPEYWKRRAKYHTARGPIWVDSTSSRKLGNPEYDPWTYIDTFSKHLEEYGNVGYLLSQKEINRIPKKFALTEVKFHAKTEGSNWVLCLPWTLEIPLDGDTAYFNLVNISPVKLTIKMKITGTDNFTIRPGIKTLEPFSAKPVALKYKRTKSMKDPYEFMKLYFIDTEAFEKAKKKFPKKRVEIATHYNGRLVVPVVVNNYLNTHPIAHNVADMYDARRARRSRAMVAKWKKELEGVAGTRKLPENYTYGIKASDNTDSSDTEALYKKEISGLTPEEEQEQLKIDIEKQKKLDRKRGKDAYFFREPKKDTIKATGVDDDGKALNRLSNAVSSDMPVVPNTVSRDVPNTVSRDLPKNTISKEGNKGKKVKSDKKDKVKQQQSSSAAPSDEKIKKKPKSDKKVKPKSDHKKLKQKESSSAAPSEEEIKKKPKAKTDKAKKPAAKKDAKKKPGDKKPKKKATKTTTATTSATENYAAM